MIEFRRSATFVFALSLGLLFFQVAGATPFVSIGEGQNFSWSQALAGEAGGTVQPATSLTDQEIAFYTAEVGPGNFGLAENIGLVHVNPIEILGEPHDALEMNWNPFAGANDPDDLSIAAWEYTYDVDPDLTASKAHFSIGIPYIPDPIDPTGATPLLDPNGVPLPAIWDVSFELIDNLGRTRSWFWPMPAVGWSQQWLMLSNAAPQGPFSVFAETPGFDITNVVTIRLDEAGMFVAFPPVPSGTPVWDWNAWDSLRITPEPSTFALLAMSLLGVLGVRRRRR